MSKIKNISIIGLGLIGGSIAKALKSSGKDYLISALDKPRVLRKALAEKVIDYKIETIKDSARSDLIFVCTPLEAALNIIEELAPLVGNSTIITDVCGVKNPLQKKWEQLKSKAVYIGGHPMTGKEKGGYENSDPLLFENSVYILSDVYKSSVRMRKFRQIIESLGARIMFLNPSLHDEIVAAVSHLPQIVSVSLVNSAASQNDGYNFLDFAAGGFRDMTRIASSKFGIWESVLKHNKVQIKKAVEIFIDELKLFNKFLQENNWQKISELFEKARKRRDEIPRNTKGFLLPLYDVFVFVKDEPGVIFKISSTLFRKNINIKDIELLKIREGTGGTFRISFETEKDAQRARVLLKKAGFQIQK